MKAFNLLTDKQLETLGRLRFQNENKSIECTIKLVKLRKKLIDEQTGDLLNASFLVKTEEFANSFISVDFDRFFVNEIIVLHDFKIIDRLSKEFYK